MSLVAEGRPLVPRDAGRPIILVVAEDFEMLMGPVRWLAEAGYDVRACLGPLGADRVCGLFEGGCPELASCDLLITNEAPTAPPRLLPPRREVVREARLRREELPILLIHDEPERVGGPARSMKARVSPPRKAPLLETVEDMVGPSQAEGAGDAG